MAPDWLVYWMTRPSGLAAIALAIAAPFALWRLVLGRRFRPAGFAPLAAGYALAGFSLVLVTLVWSYIEFTSRVAAGGLVESQRWAVVPGWVVYFSVLSLAIALPILGLFAVPASAWLVRKNCLHYRTMLFSLSGVWLALALLMWLLPSNEWHRTNRLESLGVSLYMAGISVVSVGLPFLFGIFFVARHRANAEA